MPLLPGCSEGESCKCLCSLDAAEGETAGCRSSPNGPFCMSLSKFEKSRIRQVIESMRVAVVKVFLALLLVLGVGGTVITGQTAHAQTSAAASPSQTDRLAGLEKQTADNTTAIATAQTAGDNGWMLVSAALVLMMSGPGLALFYGGLVRKKNVLGTMMQTFAMMALVTVLWALVSYSLAFGQGNAFIGGFHNAFLQGVGLAPDPAYAATIPLQTFMVYQLMFAIITPALITGAFAERMKFSSMLVFMTLWSLFIYSPMAHMVWGKGGLLNAAQEAGFHAWTSRAEPWST